MIINKFLFILSFLLIISGTGISQTLTISDSKIVCFEEGNKLVLKSVSVLQEEIEKRSGIHLPSGHKWPRKEEPVIAVGLEGNTEKFPVEIQHLLSEMPVISSEGYKIGIHQKSKTVFIVGHDARGVL